MRVTNIAIALSAGLLAIPASAQSSAANEAAEAAAEAAREAVEGYAGEGGYNPNPRPKTSAYDWFTPADYPPEAWVAGMEGEVGYRLQVDARGMATSCSVIQSSGHELLDSETCRIARSRAEFEPGQDDYGNPIASSYENYAYWEKRKPELEHSFLVRVRFTVDERGEVTECETLEISEDLPEGFRQSFERNPCPSSASRGVPYRDENGVPVAKSVVLQLAVDVDEP